VVSSSARSKVKFPSPLQAVRFNVVVGATLLTEVALQVVASHIHVAQWAEQFLTHNPLNQTFGLIAYEINRNAEERGQKLNAVCALFYGAPLFHGYLVNSVDTSRLAPYGALTKELMPRLILGRISGGRDTGFNQ